MKFFTGLTLFVICFGCLQFADAGEQRFQVVVNPANPVADVDQRFLAEIFLKKKIFWPNNRPIEVIDLDSSSSIRKDFSERVLERPVSAIRIYWQQLLFSGRAVPPPEFRSEEDVVEFVSTHEDAIGYVSNRTELKALKVIAIK